MLRGVLTPMPRADGQLTAHAGATTPLLGDEVEAWLRSIQLGSHGYGEALHREGYDKMIFLRNLAPAEVSRLAEVAKMKPKHAEVFRLQLAKVAPAPGGGVAIPTAAAVMTPAAAVNSSVPVTVAAVPVAQGAQQVLVHAQPASSGAAPTVMVMQREGPHPRGVPPDRDCLSWLYCLCVADQFESHTMPAQGMQALRVYRPCYRSLLITATVTVAAGSCRGSAVFQRSSWSKRFKAWFRMATLSKRGRNR